MKRAACAFVRNQSGRVLAVARRGTTDQWGLPGGKIDGDEAGRVSAARELKEETGLEVSYIDLEFLYENLDGHGYVCTTYLAKAEDIKKSGLILSGDAGPAAWITEEELLSGPFQQYNAAVLRAEKEGNKMAELKLTVLGSGSAFAKKNYQTNFLLSRNGRNLLFDCGGDIRWALDEQGLTHTDVHALYISHAHADHCGGVECAAFCSYFDPSVKDKPKFFAEQQLVKSLWNNTLSGGLEGIERIDARLDTYFDVCPVKRNSSFMWEGVKFELVQSLHISAKYSLVDSFGLMFTSPHSGKRIYLTSDVQFAPETSMKAYYSEADLIVHDCETMYHSGVHAHYDQLKTLAPDLKAKMMLCHYQDNVCDDPQPSKFQYWNMIPQDVRDKIVHTYAQTNHNFADWTKKAEDDGFIGFMQKGDVIPL